MSIIPESEIESNKINDDEENYEPVEKQKRSTYNEGGSISTNLKITGVKRLIMLYIVSKIKETYENIKILFNLIQINRVSFKFSADFKLLLLINGQQTATFFFRVRTVLLILTQ